MSAASDESKRLFGCPQCSRRFTRHENLKRHIGTSHQQQYHQCKYCVKQLKRQDLLKRHVKLLHKDKFETEYGQSISGSSRVGSKEVIQPSHQVAQKSPVSSSSDGSMTPGIRTNPPPQLFLPPFQAPDIPKSYDPKLHQYYSDLPFLPPKFLTHYKDIFCDRILASFPVFDRRYFDEEKVAASFLRAIVSIGCVVTGLPNDKKLGYELWESGCSLIEVFLSQDKEERYQLDWVQATISLLIFNGLFSFDSIGDEQLLIFKRLWICSPRLGMVEGTICDVSSRYILPCQYCYYIVNTLLVMFTQNRSWYLSMSDLDGYVPELDKQLTLSEALVVLSKGPIVLKDVSSTSLLLICGAYELLEHDLKLKRLFSEELQGPESFGKKISKILDNLAESIRLFLLSSPSPPKNQELFWCLWHGARIRTLIPEIFFERSKGNNKVLRVDGVNSPFQTLRFELKSMKQYIHEKQLQNGDSWENQYIRFAPTFIWSLQQISSGLNTRSEIPIERLVHIRIIFYGILLIQKLEDSKDGYEQQYLKTLTDELRDLITTSPTLPDQYPLLSQTLFQFMKDTLSSDGAWHVGAKLEEIIDSFANFLNRPKIRGRATM